MPINLSVGPWRRLQIKKNHENNKTKYTVGDSLNEPKKRKDRVGSTVHYEMINYNVISVGAL